MKEEAGMRTRRLGRTAVEVTELGFGGGPLGGLFAPLDDDTAAQALAAAWDSGIRYFDTSPHYGIGHSERRIGELLRGKPRTESVLSTKVGRLLVPQDPADRMDEAFAVPATHPGCGTSPARAFCAASPRSRPGFRHSCGPTCAARACWTNAPRCPPLDVERLAPPV